MHLSAEAEKEQVVRLIRKLGFGYLPSSHLFFFEGASFTITIDQEEASTYKAVIDFLGTYLFRVMKTKDERLELMRLQQQVFAARSRAFNKVIKVVT